MHDALRRLIARPIAHRGLHACGGEGAVENSIGAAEAAIAAGYGIECDVQLSRDGEAMVFHDEELERLTGARGRIDRLGHAELSGLSLRGGPDRIPTLEAFLAAIGGRVPLVIEVKSENDPRLVDRTLALIEAYDGPAAIESFDPTVVRRCRERGARCPVGLVGPASTGSSIDPAVLADCDFLSWDIDHLAEIAAAGHGLPLTSWTVRTAEQQVLATSHGAQIVFEGVVPRTEP